MTTPTQDTRDRVIRMEERLKGLEGKFDAQSSKINEMYDLLTKARGAKLSLILVAALVGSFLTKIMPLISQWWPR